MKKKGLDPTEKDNIGSTALHLAAWGGSVEAVRMLIREYPKVAAQSWVNNKNGDTPDSLAANKGMSPTPRALLRELLAEATAHLISGNPLPKTYSLLEAFSDDWQTFLLEPNDIDIDALMQCVDRVDCPETLSRIVLALRSMLSLRAIETSDKVLDFNLLRTLLKAARSVLDQKKQGFFDRPSRFIQTLITCARHIRDHKNKTVDEQAARTLNVILHDYERAEPNAATKAVDKMVAGKLLATQTLTLMRPQPTETQGRDIKPDNYRDHFQTMQKTFDGLPVSEETQRIIKEIIFSGVTHILTHEDAIVQHVTTNYGVLYYLVPDKLPLHTDHVEYESPEAYRDLLHRILENLFGAFYVCQEAGQLPEFFRSLTDGFCFEGRIQDTFRWAVSFSEIKPFDAFIEGCVKDYFAYQAVLHNQTEEEAANIDSAAEFILSRYDGFPCKKNSDYAPDSEITEEGVKRYLTLLAYDEPERKRCSVM